MDNKKNVFDNPNTLNTMSEFITQSEEETFNLAKRFAARLNPGDTVALIGDLGCGKTAFVKGVAAYFGCDTPVTSPTFTLVNQYDGDTTIYHFDVYRLSDPSIDECDWMDDYLFGDGICLIEWADNITRILPKNTITVSFKKNLDISPSSRRINISLPDFA